MVISGNEENVITTDDTDHIRDWIEEHEGKPAKVDKPGTDVRLGIIFEDEDSDSNLEEISWEEFFEILDEKDLKFAYAQDSGIHLSSEKFDFRDRTEANTEMEEPGVFDNTLETGSDEEEEDDTLP